MSAPDVCSLSSQDSLSKEDDTLGGGDQTPRREQSEPMYQFDERGTLVQGDRLRCRPDDNLRIVTLNIQGGLNTKLTELFEWMQRDAIDMLCIQEHNSSKRTLAGLHYSLKHRGGLYGTASDKQVGGVAILLSRQWVPSLQRIVRSKDGRSIALDFLTRSCRPVRVVCTYGPTSPRSAPPGVTTPYVEELRDLLMTFRREQPLGRLFVAGDFNMVERPNMDRDSQARDCSAIRPTEYEKGLIELLLEAQLVDTFRQRHQLLRSFTHEQATRGGISRARLDRIYAERAEGLTAALHVTSYDGQTDHCPVFADFCHSVYLGNMKQCYRRPAPREPRPNLMDVDDRDNRWERFKENTSVANLDRDVRPVGEALDSISKALFTQAMQLFPAAQKGRAPPDEEGLQLRELHFVVTLLRRACRIHAHDWKLSSTKTAMQRVCRQLRKREIVFPVLSATGLEQTSFREIRSMLETKRDELRRRSQQRKRSNMSQLEQKRLSLFTPHQLREWFRKVGRKNTLAIDTRTVCTIVDGQRVFSSSEEEVKGELSRRYYSISANPGTVPSESASEWGRRTYVPAQEAATLADVLRPITGDELDAAIARLPTRKAPGPDGVRAELYKFAHPSVRDALRNCFNAILAGGDPPRSWSHGHIFPVPKADGIPNVENSRPISLLSTQRKLFERIVCDRLTEILDKERILHEDQHGFCRGRSTLTPIMVLNSILEHARDTETPMYGVLFDVSKAFDTVPREGLDQSMQRLGFPDGLRRLLLTLNSAATAQVITAHGLTEEFDVERGVRQGSILSPLLWRIFMDPVLCQWRGQIDPYALGNGHGGHVHIFGQAYADDAVGYASSEEGLEQRIRSMELFCEYHGMKLNMSKSEIISNQTVDAGSDLNRLKLIMKAEPFRYLGIWFTVTLDWSYQETKLAERLGDLAAELRAKRLSYYEAATLYKATVTPTVSYVASVAGISDVFLKRWDSVFGHILLNKLRIGRGTTRSVLYGGERSLGLRLPSLYDVRRVRHINEMIHGLNSEGTLATVLSSGVARLQFEWGLHDLPFSMRLPKSIRSNSFPSRVWIYLTEWQMKIAAPEWEFSFRPRNDGTATQLLRDLLPKSTSLPIWRELASLEKFFLEDVLDHNRNFVADLRLRGRRPAWLRLILKYCTDPLRPRRLLPHLLVPAPAYLPPSEREIRGEPAPRVPRPTAYTVATDGALRPGDDVYGRAATAICIFDARTLVRQVGKRVDHWSLNSTEVELLAILDALRLTPTNCPVTILTDSQTCVDRLRGPERTLTTRQILDAQARPLWRSAHRLILSREASTQFCFVKAHTTDDGALADVPDTPTGRNRLADSLAKRALSERLPAPTSHILADELKVVLMVSGRAWIHKPSVALWRTARTVHDESLFSKRRQGAASRHFLSAPSHPRVDTSLFLKMSAPKWTGKSPSFLRKLWLNVLPTASVLALRKEKRTEPPEDACRFCDQGARETNTHALVACSQWADVRSDLLQDLGALMFELLADTLAQMPQIEQPSPLRLLEASGILRSTDAWFGLLPKGVTDLIRTHTKQKDGKAALGRLYDFWTREALPALWRERCRRLTDPEAYVRRHPLRVDIAMSYEELQQLETACEEVNVAHESLSTLLQTGLVDVTQVSGRGCRRDFSAVRDKVRLLLATPFRSLYVDHKRWEALASGSLATCGPMNWSFGYFHDQLKAAWMRHTIMWQQPMRASHKRRPRLPESLLTLIAQTLHVRVQLYCSALDCYHGFTSWFSREEADRVLGFGWNGYSQEAMSVVRGACALSHPPGDMTSLRRAVLFATRAVRTHLPTRLLLVLPSTPRIRRDLNQRIRDGGGERFARINPGILRLPTVPSLSLLEHDDTGAPCEVATDLYLFENAAGTQRWPRRRDTDLRWEAWLEEPD